MDECCYYSSAVLFKGPLSVTPLFLFIYKSFGIIFYAKAVKRKEVTVKLLKVVEENFNNSTYSNTIRFHFTMQF